MEFKTDSLKAQFANSIDGKLRLLLEGLDAYCVNNGFPELIITELIRLPRHASDEHAVGRAADVRAHAEATCEKCGVERFRYTPEQLAMMRQYIETNHKRKAWYNKAGQGLTGFYPHGRGAVFHIHLSVD
jgi:hypothetical protein